jgi:hypothetical protein
MRLLRRRDDGHQLIAAFGGLADRLQHHAVGLPRELLPVRGQLLIVGQEIVVAEVVPEFLLRPSSPRGVALAHAQSTARAPGHHRQQSDRRHHAQMSESHGQSVDLLSSVPSTFL